MTSPVLALLAAAAPAGDAPPAWVQFVPLIGIAGVFWFLLLRPQMRQQKEHREKIASVKKGDLAMSAERVFAGTYITEVEVRDRALAWVPEVMRFAGATSVETEADEAQVADPTDSGVVADESANDDHQTLRELAA